MVPTTHHATRDATNLLTTTPDEAAIIIACALTDPMDLLRLARACRRFAIKCIATPAANRAAHASGCGTTAAQQALEMWSIVEEAARRWIATRTDQCEILGARFTLTDIGRSRYNKINGVWSCENPETLGNLKKDLGFEGWVMSDWGATHSTSIMAGLDQEMPSAQYMNDAAIGAGIAAKNITEAAVDDSVTRILTGMFLAGVMDKFDEDKMAYDFSKHSANVTSESAANLARELSANSTVLLKNEGGVLPLTATGSELELRAECSPERVGNHSAELLEESLIRRGGPCSSRCSCLPSGSRFGSRM